MYACRVLSELLHASHLLELSNRFAVLVLLYVPEDHQWSIWDYMPEAIKQIQLYSHTCSDLACNVKHDAETAFPASLLAFVQRLIA